MYGRPGGKLTEPILVGLCGSVWVSGLYFNAPDPDIDLLEIVPIFQASLGMGNGRYWMEYHLHHLFRGGALPTGLWRLLPPFLFNLLPLEGISAPKSQAMAMVLVGAMQLWVLCSCGSSVQPKRGLPPLFHFLTPSSHPWAWPPYLPSLGS